MSLRANVPTMVVIDGPHLYMASRSLGFDVDFRRLAGWLEERCQPRRLQYLTTVLDTAEGERNPLAPLVQWLGYNGFQVMTKPAREFVDEETGRRRVKGSLLVETTVALMEAAAWGAQQVFLIAGDGELTAAIESIQRRGTRVVLASTIKTSPPLASDDLRRAADLFIDLADLTSEFGKESGQARARKLGSTLGTTERRRDAESA
jgi:uncharacterized LabA/DUF88 family protein